MGFYTSEWWPLKTKLTPPASYSSYQWNKGGWSSHSLRSKVQQMTQFSFTQQLGKRMYGYFTSLRNMTLYEQYNHPWTSYWQAARWTRQPTRWWKALKCLSVQAHRAEKRREAEKTASASRYQLPPPPPIICVLNAAPWTILMWIRKVCFVVCTFDTLW